MLSNTCFCLYDDHGERSDTISSIDTNASFFYSQHTLLSLKATTLRCWSRAQQATRVNQANLAYTAHHHLFSPSILINCFPITSKYLLFLLCACYAYFHGPFTSLHLFLSLSLAIPTNIQTHRKTMYGDRLVETWRRSPCLLSFLLCPFWLSLCFYHLLVSLSFSSYSQFVYLQFNEFVEGKKKKC